MMICCFWSWLVQNAAAVSAIAAVVAVFITLLSLHANKKVERARLRPIVSASIECADNTYTLVVRNLGLSAAHEVKISVSPHIKIRLSSDSEGEIPFIEHPIPTLMPSSSLQSAFVIGYDDLKMMSREMRFTISMEYEGDNAEKYKTAQKIDVRLIADAAILKHRSGAEIIAKAISDSTAKLIKGIEHVG